MQTTKHVSADSQQTLYFLPASDAFHRLRALRIAGRAAEHGRAETHALAQMVVADNASTRELFAQLLSFASGARSLAGLEAIFLSSMVSLQALGDSLLYRVGVQAWRSHEPATKYLPGESLLTIFDRANALFTFLPGSALGSIHHFLIRRGFGSTSLGAAIRNPGSVTDIPYDISVNRPGGMFSGDTFGKCVAKITAICTVAGLVGGAAAGMQVVEGAGAGGIIGGILGGWLCADPPPDDNDPNAPVSDPGLPVSAAPDYPTDASAPDQESPDDAVPNDAGQAAGGVSSDSDNADTGEEDGSGSSGSDDAQGQEGPDQSFPDGSNQSVDSPPDNGTNQSLPGGPDDGQVANFDQTPGGPEDGSTVGSNTPELIHIHRAIGLRIRLPRLIGRRFLVESLSVPRASGEEPQQVRYGNSLTFLIHPSRPFTPGTLP